MAKANVDTISKYNNAFAPIFPTFFKLPMPEIPSTIVRKIIGAMKILMMSINPLPTISKFTAAAGAKWPSAIPETMATITQNVRLVKIAGSGVFDSNGVVGRSSLVVG